MNPSEEKLHRTLAGITPPSQSARAAAQARWNACAKPLGSLGLLEDVISDIAALTGSPEVTLDRRSLLVLCADNGVVAQGVTQTDSSVTGVVAQNLAAGRTSVCRMARLARCPVIPVDMGMLDFPGHPGVLDRRVGNGTADFTLGPAMTREQAVSAILVGIQLVRWRAEAGDTLLATGEMGIGNTTTTSALLSLLLDRPVEEMTGRGAGLSDQGLRRKIAAIHRGIQRNAPDPSDPIDLLSKVGGFDLAGLCGLFLGGALYQIPVLVDGVISAAAALCALRLCPAAGKSIFASHVSAEPAGRLALNALGKCPLITAEMRLGEGTGAVAAIPLLDMALAVYRESYTFQEGNLTPYTPQAGDGPC